jgi:hypothetical protein
MTTTTENTAKAPDKVKAPADHKTPAKRTARPTGGTAPKGEATGNGKTAKTPKAPKLTAREQVAQRRAEAEGAARKLREAQDDGGQAAIEQAQRVSDAAYSHAVLALLALDARTLADTDRRYVIEHGGAVIHAMTQAEAAKGTAEAAHKGTAQALATAKSVAAERTRDTAMFLWSLCDVHKIMSQGKASKLYGITQPNVSRYVLTGRAIARFNLAKAPSKVVTIHQAAGEKRAELQSAMATEDATFDTVREAVGSVPSRSRREAEQAEAEDVPTETAKLAAKLTNGLLVMAETKAVFPDLAESTGEEIARALLLAVSAYARRTELPLTEAHRQVLV